MIFLSYMKVDFRWGTFKHIKDQDLWRLSGLVSTCVLLRDSVERIQSVECTDHATQNCKWGSGQEGYWGNELEMAASPQSGEATDSG